jgi:2,3,4,5-tetrahydropyridine-2-carboxylate N-succinyltransferase
VTGLTESAAAAELRVRIDTLSKAGGTAQAAADDPAVRVTIEALMDALEAGTVRAADRAADGTWHAVPWVKRGILQAFRLGTLADQSPRDAKGRSSGPFSFFDKDTLVPRNFAVTDNVRVVPGGTTIRRGAYLANSVVCMPPSYVNVGAHIETGTMIDSHVLVGSCAQIGERVHLSAGVQIGGVLEPINAAPVIVENDVVVGGNCGVYEGTIVRSRAVLGAGVILTRGTPVYDLVRQAIYRASATGPLEIPSGAVVVPGTRPIATGWGASQGLAVHTPIVVKYRDDRTDAATALEAWLR